MTSKQLTAVALKCLAIYLLFTAVVAFPMWIYFVRRAAGTGLSPLASAGVTTAAVVVCSLLTAGAAFLAWRLANRLADLVSAPPTDDIHVNITPRRLEEILFRVLGVYLAVTHLKPFVNEIIRRQVQAGGGYDTREIQWNLFATLGVLIFGLVLTFKPRVLIDRLDRLTRRTTPEAPTNESRATSDSAPSADSEVPHS
jgi:hypothetical protein